MSNIIPASADAQEAFRCKHIFLSSFLEEQRNAELLWEQSLRLKATTTRSKALKHATLAGYCALISKANDSADQLRRRGQLLFAFRETKHPGAIA